MLGTPAAPTLETPRLILRGWRPEDLAPYAAMLAEPETARFITRGGEPYSQDQVWAEMAWLMGHWQMLGCGLFVVEERATGAFLGRIGCLEPEGWPGFEVAYTLARHAWGRGYAREGAAAALRWAREALGRDDVISIIRPANARSIRVATALGATPDGTVEFFGAPAVLYRYPPVG